MYDSIKNAIEHMSKEGYKPPYFLISLFTIDISKYPEIEQNITSDLVPNDCNYYLIRKKDYKPLKLY